MTPPCLETNLLCIETEGVWRWHAKAKKRIAAGTVLTRNAPLAHQLLSSGEICGHCFSAPTKLYNCSSCRKIQYCGRACQRDDFAQHKLECQFFKDQLENNNEIYQQDEKKEICFLLRAFGSLNKLMKKKEQHSCQTAATRFESNGNGLKTKIICCGLHHWNEMVQAPCFLVQPASSMIVEAVKQYTSWDSNDIQRALRIFQANNFGISSNALYDTMGQGVYPHAAILNHSCDPNCVLRYVNIDQSSKISSNGIIMEIVALADIQPGDELTHSYVDLVQDTTTRQHHLEQLHGFHCNCRRCQGKVTVELPAIVLPAKHLYKWLVRRRNPTILLDDEDASITIMSVDDALKTCGARGSASQALQRLLEAQQLQQDACQHMLDDDLCAELVALEQAVTLLQESQSLLSRELYQARGSYLSSLLANIAAVSFNDEEQEKYRTTAAEQCLAMVAFLSVSLPKNHPLLGLQLFTLGDLMMGDVTPDSQKSVYKWARIVLRISHGQQHDLVRRLDAVLSTTEYVASLN